MRVLFATSPSPARLYNLVPLGWALRAAGHEVQVAARADVTGTVTRTGFVAVALGADSSAVDLADHAARWRPDLVIWDPGAAGGDAAARSVGAMSVRMLGYLDHAGKPADGAGPPERGDLTLDTTPPAMRTLAAEAGEQIAVRYVFYDGPAEIPVWLRRTPRRPRAYLALGGSPGRAAEVFDAVAGLDLELVCALPAELIPAGAGLPDNVRLVDSVPLAALLPTCAAIVHDGAPEAVAAALAHGLVPLALQDLAERAGPLADRISHLICDPAARAAAERSRAELQALPSPHDLVPELVRRIRAGCGAGGPV
jgi:UDP:flavonoid glycosyltransferase YjiC (YdhE family)